jgi:hypothetical protein
LKHKSAGTLSVLDCLRIPYVYGAWADNTRRRYLQERFVDALPAHNKPKSFTFVSGAGTTIDPATVTRRDMAGRLGHAGAACPPSLLADATQVGDPRSEVARLHAVISAWPEIDVSFIGIGENGHLAFNDPPCDLTVEVGECVSSFS